MKRVADHNHWMILRTAGPRTLPLAKSLEDAKFEVWTPVQKFNRKRPRSRLVVECEAPITPTFVFARYRHYDELTAIIASPVSPHPQFSIFTWYGAAALIDDAELQAVREFEEGEQISWEARRIAEERRLQAERLRKLRRSPNTWEVGEEVRIPEKAFDGMIGKVQQTVGDRHALIDFGGKFPLKIAAWRLRSTDVSLDRLLKTEPAGPA